MSMFVLVLLGALSDRGDLRLALVTAILAGLTGIALVNAYRDRRAHRSADQFGQLAEARSPSPGVSAPDRGAIDRDPSRPSSVTEHCSDTDGGMDARSPVLTRSLARLETALWRFDFADRRLTASIEHLRERMHRRMADRVAFGPASGDSLSPPTRDAPPDWLLRDAFDPSGDSGAISRELDEHAHDPALPARQSARETIEA